MREGIGRILLRFSKCIEGTVDAPDIISDHSVISWCFLPELLPFITD